jgi:hypothetical protein
MQPITRSPRDMSDSESFYLPTSGMLKRDKDAWQMFTTYAARLQDVGLERSFPSDDEVRYVAIELLAERYSVEDVADDPRRIADAMVEAVEIRRARRS